MEENTEKISEEDKQKKKKEYIKEYLKKYRENGPNNVLGKKKKKDRDIGFS